MTLLLRARRGGGRGRRSQSARRARHEPSHPEGCSTHVRNLNRVARTNGVVDYHRRPTRAQERIPPASLTCFGRVMVRWNSSRLATLAMFVSLFSPSRML